MLNGTLVVHNFKFLNYKLILLSVQPIDGNPMFNQVLISCISLMYVPLKDLYM